jgi:5'-nucleotidase
VTPDPAVEAMLAPFREDLAEEFDVKIGEATDFFPRGAHEGVDNYERLGEAEVGNLMTDSFIDRYGTDFAFTNSGGIRSPLPSDYVPADTTLDRDGVFPDDLVLGDVFQFHSFGNTVVTREVSGALLHEMMEHGLGQLPNADGRFPQIAGFEVTYNSALPAGSRVVTIQLPDGTPVLADSTVYTIALPDFVNAGGDGYTMLADGVGTTREPLTTVVEAYIRAQGSITPFLDCRLADLDATSVGGMRQTCP